ncbi:protein translocase subunit SecF [Phaeacidiphilus oryzae]|jgi:preprotein translocase subunit SecF|uniref:protein translocase subunit SecF n=1 Tax=Phaeacidiphilus oryzae TaxID=348818 RepID=UPI0005665463|nr:protein translocase subunit SecF [Phaeacidiphilus oryzae]
MSRLGHFGARLHRGEVSFDFVGRQKVWYGISVLIIVLAGCGLLFRGLNYGIEFKGGAVFTVKPAHTISTEQVRSDVAKVSGGDPIVQTQSNGDLRIQVGSLDSAKAHQVQDALATDLNVPVSSVATQVVGPSWGSQITHKAVEGLIIFLVLVVAYMAIAFEWRMAVAALVALLHDIVITVGVYALVGFQVTPATVTGLLTILGYSLYDTVVVFDKVKENTRKIESGNKITYSEAANLAVNQTLARSINTSLVALLPIAAMLFVGEAMLGASDLNDLALALFVGILAGTYSSIFIATPLLADLKERQPEFKALAKRVRARRASDARKAAEAAERGEGTVPEGSGVAGAPEDAVPAVAGPRRQPVHRNRASRKRH